jgi:serine protease AprX
MIDLDDATIHRLVFETFGLRRYTQDSPIQPDVWVWLIKLAARNRLDERISLILTPKETPGKKGKPPGGAGELAEKVRQSVLGLERRNQEREVSAEAKRIAPEGPLGQLKIASTSRNVVLEANFAEILTYLLPLTAWWCGSVDKALKSPAKLGKILAKLGLKRPIADALVRLDNTEFFRFAALTAITAMIGALGTSDDPQNAKKMIDWLAPRRKDEIDDFLDSSLHPPTVGDVAELWVHYGAIARATFARPSARAKSQADAAERSKVDSLNAASLDTEVQIWSIQRNRRAFREGTKRKKIVLPAGATRVAPVRLSYQTIKADAAIKLFSISTADLTWAIIDTGIDANHPAFKTPDRDLPSRVVATLDFTRLRDLLAEEFDLDQLVKDFHWGPTDPSTEADRKKKLLVTINSIRRRNVNGRELDWSLLEPLIRREPLGVDTPVPLDAHGTHVAGILASRELEKDEAGNDAKFIGVCPDIKLYDLRVFGDDGGGDEFTILAALDYVSWVNRDPERPTIHGVNLSLSLRHEVDAHACGRTPVCNACNRLVGAGTVVVAAAGNAGFDPSMGKATLGSGYRGTSITDPGNADLVITVGATHRNDPHTYGVSYFSSRGPTGDGRQKPDLVAPGEKINSSVPGSKMMIKDGTSMAAPHVSGACALLMARHREFIGQPMRIKDVLMKTATDLGRERCFQGAGLVDALRALQSV